MELEWIFAYGSNMHLPNLRAWLTERGHGTDGIKSIARATLQGHRLAWNYYSMSRRGGAANIEASSGQLLPGIALQVDRATLAAIDEKEGHPRYYSRGATTTGIELDDGSTVPGWVYVARPERCKGRPQWPTRDYRALLIEAAVAHALSEEHITYLKELPVCD